MNKRLTGDKKSQTQERILGVAAKAIREHGYHGVGVADLMKEAGLTHGGFYAHFASRNAMLVKAIQRAALDSGVRNKQAIDRLVAQGQSPFAALVNTYLSTGHLKSVADGCPIAALGSEIARQDETVRLASLTIVEHLQRAVAAALPDSADANEASAVVSAMVGALQLARAQGDNEQGKATLVATKTFLLKHYDH